MAPERDLKKRHGMATVDRALTASRHVQLRTNRQPFFVAGTEGSDLLSLFRCLSCRYEFGTDERKPRELGAPGRVFLSSGPEVRANVQRLDPSEYHRRPSAELCSVESCMLLPVFGLASGGACRGVVAVIEVIGGVGAQYLSMVELLEECLQSYGLSTSSVDEVKLHMEDEDMDVVGDDSQPENQITGTDAQFGAAMDASANQLVELSGYVLSDKASKKLKMTPVRLKNIMQKNKINTVSRKDMRRYELEVDGVLQGNRQQGWNVPLAKGIDSRWHAVRRFRRNNTLYTVSGVAHPVQPPDGAFPIQPLHDVMRIEPDVGLLQQWPGLEGMKQNVHAPGVQIYQKDNDNNDDVMTSDHNNNNNKTTAVSTVDDDSDWLGMIDPFMLDIMMMNDFGEEGGIGDIRGLPPTI